MYMQNLTITLTATSPGTICHYTLLLLAVFLSLSGVLWILEGSLHQEASWTAQNSRRFCHSVLSLTHGHHACLREREAVNLTADQYIFKILIG